MGDQFKESLAGHSLSNQGAYAVTSLSSLNTYH